MLYTDFKGTAISKLAFGAMRLPVKEDKSIDEELTQKMVDLAMSSGVNYYDTAWPYHGGKSEIVLGKCLSKYPREKWMLADKFPGFIKDREPYPAPIFEEQLKKCGVDYFDFYLFHSVTDDLVSVYKDEKWGIADYLIEQKKNGRIKHLGFSCHGTLENMKDFIEYCHGEIEFVQIQLNYLDWTLQDAKAKYDYLKSKGLGIMVMEPVRGGKLANLSPGQKQLLEKADNDTAPHMAFRWLQGLDALTVTLSGMSNLEQMQDNIKTFEKLNPLTDEQNARMAELAETLKNAIPCTACRYCTAGCPQNLNIPQIISLYNDAKFSTQYELDLKKETSADELRPSACIECGQCTSICPQHIDIPKVMRDLDSMI